MTGPTWWPWEQEGLTVDGSCLGRTSMLWGSISKPASTRFRRGWIPWGLGADLWEKVSTHPAVRVQARCLSLENHRGGNPAPDGRR